jgi:hypothetical protein
VGFEPIIQALERAKTIDVLDRAAGRAIVQVVSRRLPTTAARVRAHVKLCGIYGGQSGTGADFLRVLRFPVQYHSTYFSTLIIIYHPGLVYWAK